MHTEHLYSSITLLKNGKILVLGGANKKGKIHAIGEIYDPKTKKYQIIGKMHFPRNGHTASLLKDGKVLITGGDSIYGMDHTQYKYAELYDPDKNVFIRIPDMHLGRKFHTASVLNNGEVLIYGGSTISVDAELYDPLTNSFKLLPGIDFRTKHQAVTLSNGNVFLFEGFNVESWKLRTDALLFNSTNIKFYRLNQVFPPASTATLINDDMLLITGGRKETFLGTLTLDSAIIYDPHQNKIIERLKMHSARANHNCIRLSDYQFLITGGRRIKILRSAEIFNVTNRRM